MIMVGGFSAAVASHRSVAANAGSAFATLCAGFATAVYFVQLATVMHQTAPSDILKIPSYQELGSVLPVALLAFAYLRSGPLVRPTRDEAALGQHV